MRVEPLPAIVQFVDANSTVVKTLLLGSGEDLPRDEPVTPVVIEVPVPVPAPPVEKRKDRAPPVIALFGIGAAFAGAGGGTFAEAYLARKKLYTETYGGKLAGDLTRQEQQFDKRRSQINARSWVPLTLGGIAGVLGVTGIVVAL